MVAAAVAAGGYLFGRGAMGADAESGDPGAMPSVPDPMPEVPAGRDIFVLTGDRNPDAETESTGPSGQSEPRDRNPDTQTTSTSRDRIRSVVERAEESGQTVQIRSGGSGSASSTERFHRIENIGGLAGSRGL